MRPVQDKVECIKNLEPVLQEQVPRREREQEDTEAVRVCAGQPTTHRLRASEGEWLARGRQEEQQSIARINDQHELDMNIFLMT